MAENKDTESSLWKKPSNNSKNRSYRDGKPKDSRLLFRERDLPKKEERHKNRRNSDHRKKERRFRDQKRDENEDSRRNDRNRYRRSPSLRKWDSREGRVSSKAKRESNDECEKRAKKRKCKHKRQNDDSKAAAEDSVAVNNDDKIKKCRHLHRHHRHHKKCKHRQQQQQHHHQQEEKPSSPVSPPLESLNAEHCSPSRMQKPSERIKTNTHLDVTPLDSKEIYAEGDKIFVNINFCKLQTASELKADFSDIRHLSEQMSDQQHQLKDASSELNASISKPGEPPKKDVKLVSKSTTEFDIFWDDNCDDKVDKSIDNKTTGEVEVRSTNSRNSFDGSPKRKTEIETNFLPRSLMTEVKNLNVNSNPLSETALAATPPQTPPNGEDDKSLSSPDQTMPTPTQDESQVDSLKDESSRSGNNNSLNSLSSPTSAVVTPKAKSQDMYDPEAPLESPDDEFDRKSGNNSKVDVSRRSVSPVKKPLSPEKPKAEVSKLKTPTKATTKTPLKALKSSVDKHNALSSQVTSTTASSAGSVALSNLMRLLPAPQAPTLPAAPPNSLLAQIQQTLFQQQKGTPQQQQQLHQLLQTASSISTMFKNSSNANPSSGSSKSHHTHDVNEVVDMDVDSPPPPPPGPISSTSSKTGNRGIVSNSSNLLTNSNPALNSVIDQLMRAAQTKQNSNHKLSSNHSDTPSTATFKRPIPVNDSLNKKYKCDNTTMSSSHSLKSKHQSHGYHSSVKTKVTIPNDSKNLSKRAGVPSSGTSTTTVVPVVDDVPSSAVELHVKEKYLKKLNRQERVVEEVKLVLKPYYQRREVTKEEYKEILRKSVPKICHSKTGEINPVKIKQLVEEYIKRMKHLRKKSKLKSGSNSTSVTKL